MERIHLDQDIQPLSTFRAKSARIIQQIQQTRRPVVLTQRGHSAAVLLDVKEYERLIEELELLRDMYVAEQKLAKDGGIPHDEAKAKVLARIRR